MHAILPEVLALQSIVEGIKLGEDNKLNIALNEIILAINAFNTALLDQPSTFIVPSTLPEKSTSSLADTPSTSFSSTTHTEAPATDPLQSLSTALSGLVPTSTDSEKLVPAVLSFSEAQDIRDEQELAAEVAKLEAKVKAAETEQQRLVMVERKLQQCMHLPVVDSLAKFGFENMPDTFEVSGNRIKCLVRGSWNSMSAGPTFGSVCGYIPTFTV